MALSRPKDESYYDILKVERKSTIPEIVAAYHSAKNAFSRDSVATYSLFSPDEAKSIIDKLDEAYQTLSNIDKKREYDRWLVERTSGTMSVPPSMTELERQKNAQMTPMEKDSLPSRGQSLGTSADATASPPPEAQPSTVTILWDQPFTGALMRDIREKRGLSLDDVSRITKIPAKFIRAIENDDAKGLPARVYLQGFVKNLASVYKLEIPTAVNAYLSYVDKLTQSA